MTFISMGPRGRRQLDTPAGRAAADPVVVSNTLWTAADLALS